MFEKEQEINNQLQKNLIHLEEEKDLLQHSLQEKDDENAALKTEILKLQANFEKNRNLNEAMGQKLREREKQMEALQEELRQATEDRISGEHDREELASQVLVLIEERDTARAQEEDLFEKLTERTADLERLQESYVDIADRCNDAQDEVLDLRDQVESLQNSLATRLQLQSVVNTPSTASNNYNNNNSGSNSNNNSSTAMPKINQTRPAVESPANSNGGAKLAFGSPVPSNAASNNIRSETKELQLQQPLSARSDRKEAKSVTENKSVSGSTTLPPVPAVASSASNGDYNEDNFEEYDEEFDEED